MTTLVLTSSAATISTQVVIPYAQLVIGETVPHITTVVIQIPTNSALELTSNTVSQHFTIETDFRHLGLFQRSISIDAPRLIAVDSIASALTGSVPTIEATESPSVIVVGNATMAVTGSSSTVESTGGASTWIYENWVSFDSAIHSLRQRIQVISSTNQIIYYRRDTSTATSITGIKGTLTLSSSAPVAIQNVSITPNTTNLLVTSTAPTTGIDTGYFIDVPVGDLSFVTIVHAPTIISNELVIGVKALLLVSDVVGVRVSAMPVTGALSLTTSIVPNVDFGSYPQSTAATFSTTSSSLAVVGQAFPTNLIHIHLVTSSVDSYTTLNEDIVAERAFIVEVIPYKF